MSSPTFHFGSRSRKITVDIDALQELFVNKNEFIGDWCSHIRNSKAQDDVDNDRQNQTHALFFTNNDWTPENNGGICIYGRVE